jgi:hypothetical protein
MAATIDGDATIDGQLAKIVVTSYGGCTVQDFILQATGTNFAAGNGLLEEGFGVGNFYVPNRRLNERLEFLEDGSGRPVLRYVYDCDGPNIAGIHAIRTMEPLTTESAMRVTWLLENRGTKAHWIAPWVRNDWAPGGKADENDILDIPAMVGIVRPEDPTFYRAARNWVAATDPTTNETVYAVFDSEKTFSFLADRGMAGEAAAVQTNFVPHLLKPGESWRTTYRINIVRGLRHVDFASDEMAVQIDYDRGQLDVRLASPGAFPPMKMEAVVVAPDGTATTLVGKAFRLYPDEVVRCMYDWVAPDDGVYEFLAQIEVDGKPYLLGQDTASPHGGIDTQFTVATTGALPASNANVMAGWTEGPYALERGPRALDRAMAAPGDTAIWFEGSLEKIFMGDVPRPTGQFDPVARVGLARNESESFQLVIRPPADTDLKNVTVKVHDLRHAATGEVIEASQIETYRQGYISVAIPSYFEGPTGAWPDALVPIDGPLDIDGGGCSPLWFTVHAPDEAAAGVYTGLLEVSGAGLEPMELWIEATVYDFALPSTPALKTDFGFSMEDALRQHSAAGYTGSPRALERAYRENAADHRVTLRPLAQFPKESADYAASLSAFAAALPDLEEAGVSTIAVAPSLLDVPQQLAMADAFVVDHKLEDRVFVALATRPGQPAWPRVFDRAQAWRETAPHIPVMVSTFGVQPFLTDVADIWTVHAPMLDTTNNAAILGRIDEGGEVWWSIDLSPPRPYGNFFVDFAAMEHRVLFWQTWALGLKGFQYWAINYAPPKQDPWQSQLDATPVNGDGFLVYPSPSGPVNSLRWEIIRDGVDDYDYLVLLSDAMAELASRGGHESLMTQGNAARNLQELTSSLTNFTRDGQVLQKKRREIAEAIVAINAALGR